MRAVLGGDGDLFAGHRVAPGARRGEVQPKTTEATDFDSIVARQRRRDCVKDLVDALPSVFGRELREALAQCCDEVGSGHGADCSRCCMGYLPVQAPHPLKTAFDFDVEAHPNDGRSDDVGGVQRDSAFLPRPAGSGFLSAARYRPTPDSATGLGTSSADRRACSPEGGLINFLAYELSTGGFRVRGLNKD